MTIEETVKRYSTLEGAIEYLKLLNEQSSDAEVGSTEWLFNLVMETTLRNLQVLDIYKKKYGKLSVSDWKLLDEDKETKDEDEK